ncbi:MAG: hypothetical protein JSV24_01440 [Bacteroidales bacterium]|nr:MAG: hypothetical protein JSV24_01440 [Bacteroidales bacterium]
MDSEQDEIVKQLKEKIRLLISFYEKAQNENETLQHERVELNKQIKFRETELQEIKNKYENLKITKTILAGSEDVHDARIKVNKIVREIDKCIALLNR